MLSLSQTPLTHSTPLTRHCHALQERRHLQQYNSIASIICIRSQSSSHQAKPIKQSVMINQSISQSINTQPQQSTSHSIIRTTQYSLTSIYLTSTQTICHSPPTTLSLSPPVILSILIATAHVRSLTRAKCTHHTTT